MKSLEELIDQYNQVVGQLQDLSITKERLFGAISALQEVAETEEVEELTTED